MNFREKLSNYVLGHFTVSNLPDIALTAIEEGYESESLIILAGLSKVNNSFEIEHYFNKTLSELNLTPLKKLDAAQILLNYYLGLIISSPENAYLIMRKIDNEIYSQVDWMQELKIEDKKFVGEELGLEKMYTWYRELQDFEDNGMLLYYNELSKEKQKEKFEQHLVEEAKTLKSIIEAKI